MLLIMSLLGAWTFSSQCRSIDSNMRITINKVIRLDSLPSGSGLELAGNNMYIISDNAPAYYKMDMKTRQYEKILIPGYPANEYIISKKTKHDLEALVTGTIKNKVYLFAFSSGSGPHRQMLLQIDPAGKEADKKLSLARLYASIKKEYDLSDEALNIEGAAICEGRLYLLLRKKNMIISMKWADFEQYINDPLEGSVPPTKGQYLTLPKHSGVSAGFSGATEIIYKGAEAIMFCASLEHTPNHTADGPVFGSYIGIIQPDEHGKMEIVALDIIKSEKGKILKEKIESIAIINSDTTNYNTLIISDNDDGHSSLLEVSITIK